MGQKVEWKNTEWDKMSNGKIAERDKTPNGKTPNGNMERKICVNIFGFLLLLRKPWDTICLKKVENG